jgi:asparagine synthase (glutamine-hydrolysing)
MCGISGKVFLNSNKVDYFDIKSMNEKIAHRGPDDSGVFISEDEKVGLGNQRLSVIDLSQNGHMPMSFKNKYTITYNGEIYNFKDEKKDLTKQGVKFKSNSDTEVILALYDKYKFDCLKHLRGMFAFAIYDKKNQTIFLARDRIGKKPLKYFFDNQVFIFASELKAILSQKEVKKEVDWDAIGEYLTYGYVPSPKTGFLNINKLDPGSYLILDLKNKDLKKVRYWRPDYSEKLDLSENDWQKSIIAKMRESVRLRMISDVPIGAFLSGGIDSSTVVTLMAQNTNKPVNTFTISFKDKNLDESKYAENIVKLYHTNHHTLLAEPENVEVLPDLARMYEEPYADASSVVTYMVSKLAKKYVTVILNGDGGDENFVGYERFQRVQRDFLIDKYLSPFKTPLSSGVNLFSKMTKNKNLVRYGKFLNKSKLPFWARYGSYIQYFSTDDFGKMKNSTLTEKTPFKEIQKVFEELGGVDPRDKALYWDLTRYLPEDLLVKVDIASMAVGLEARSPFLDQELIEFACKMPFDKKIAGGDYKHLLKKAIKDIVPDENVYRRKIGFTIPLDRWFEGSLNEYSKSILLNKNSFVSQIFNQSYVKEMLSKHSKVNDFGPRLWSLLSLELWHKAYF